MLGGLAAGTVLATALNQQGARLGWEPVAVVGAIPSPWPAFAVPAVDWSKLPELLGLAAALTIVALGQSISIAKAVAQRSGQRIDANREFLGQGLSNLVGGFFSSYVSCGSLNRSMPNLEAGVAQVQDDVGDAGIGKGRQRIGELVLAGRGGEVGEVHVPHVARQHRGLLHR